MEKLGTFIAMGGYGGYVWSAYALALAVIGGLWLFARRRKRGALQKNARRLFAAQEEKEEEEEKRRADDA